MVQINDDYYEDLTPENFEKLLDDLAAGRPVKQGSQIGRNALRAARGGEHAHRPVALRRLDDRRLAQALRGGGRQDLRTGEAAARPRACRQAPRPQSRRPAARSRPKPPTRRPKRAKEGEAADQPGGAQGRGRSVEGDRRRASDREAPTPRRRAPNPIRRHRRSRKRPPGRRASRRRRSAGTPPSEAATRRDGSQVEARTWSCKDDKSS